MRSARLVVVLAVVAAGLAGCWNPTGSDRCDRVLGDAGVLQAVDDHGWIGVNCAPWFPPPAVNGATESGWANESSTAKGAVPLTIYLWPPDDDRVLIMLAGHEDGHVVEAMYGHPRDEARASAWSWCNWPQPGVGDGTGGYREPAGGCAGFIP